MYQLLIVSITVTTLRVLFVRVEAAMDVALEDTKIYNYKKLTSLNLVIYPALRNSLLSVPSLLNSTSLLPFFQLVRFLTGIRKMVAWPTA